MSARERAPGSQLALIHALLTNPKFAKKNKKFKKFKKLKKLKITVDFFKDVLYSNIRQRELVTRKCRNWQTSKPKDLVHGFCVRVQVPSSA